MTLASIAASCFYAICKGMFARRMTGKQAMTISRSLILALCSLWVLAPAAPAAAAPAEYEWKDGQWVKVAPPAKGTPEGEVALMRQYVEQGKSGSSQAIKFANAFIKERPDSPYRQDIMLLAGEAEINREHYFQAYEWYEKLLAQFHGGEYYERALLREFFVAEQFLAGKKRLQLAIFWVPAQDDGLDILRRIAEHVPGTDLAEKAMLRIGDYHFGRMEWTAAADAYDAYLQLFPRSYRAQYAMLQAATSLYNSYRGSEYDDTPLIEAQQRFKAFQERYPAAAAKANVSFTLKQIVLNLAAKQLEIAKFYQRTGHPQTAIYYYKLVERDWADTPSGLEAKAFLARLPAGAIGGPKATTAPAPPATMPATRPSAPLIELAPSHPASGPATPGAAPPATPKLGS
jgi:outer membrane protein assembly factor BamD (BamD/ComL family)